MAFLRKRAWVNVFGEFRDCFSYSRFYSSKINFRDLMPEVLKRIEHRAKYPHPHMVPVAKRVLRARARLVHGISTLLRVFPVVTCKFCREVYVGENGHLIRTCSGPWGKGKNFLHRWVSGGLSDILVEVETFHLKNLSHDVIEHHQKFDFACVPAVLKLCRRLGVHPSDETLYSNTSNSESISDDVKEATSLSSDELKLIANETFKAWETLRAGVQRLLLVYPAKVCTYCSEVKLGPSVHNARLCRVYEYENWRGTHLWKRSNVDDLLPENIVWHQRSVDPPVLLNKGRGYYGHLPAVVELCVQAGFVPPSKYFYMMKVHGLP